MLHGCFSYCPSRLGLAAYRLSMNVLYGANLISLWSASGFMLGFGSASKAQLLRKPRMLFSAVTVAAFYLTLAYT